MLGHVNPTAPVIPREYWLSNILSIIFHRYFHLEFFNLYFP